jgi:hypothetical protein
MCVERLPGNALDAGFFHGHGFGLPGKFMEDNGPAAMGEKLKKPNIYAALPFFIRSGKGRKKC